MMPRKNTCYGSYTEKRKGMPSKSNAKPKIQPMKTDAPTPKEHPKRTIEKTKTPYIISKKMNRTRTHWRRATT